MAIEVLLETTADWKVDYTVPCHTYVYDTTKGKMLGYRTAAGEIRKCLNPISFSKSRRKFKKVVDKELLDAIINT
jgi:hypothetical protein